MSSAPRSAALTVLGLLVAATAFAGPPGFAFLETPAGARAAGLGGAYESVAQGVEAIFFNPASLDGVQGTQVTGAHAEFIQQLRHDQFAIGGRLFGGGLAASMRALYSEPIAERDELGNLIGSFGAHDLEFALGYGRTVASGVTFGATTQLIRERIANESAMTWAVGFGSAWEPSRWPALRLSASAHNLGPAAHYEMDGVQGTPVALPAALQTGASYAFGVASNVNLRAALETRVTRGRPGVAMLGGELDTPVGAMLRLGLRMNDELSNFSMGAGYRIQKLQLDYAFVPSRLGLEDTHRFAFRAQF